MNERKTLRKAQEKLLRRKVNESEERKRETIKSKSKGKPGGTNGIWFKSFTRDSKSLFKKWY